MEILITVSKEKIIFHTSNKLALLELIYDNQKQMFCVTKTFVDEKLRGQGFGEKLYQVFVDYVLQNQIKFYSICSFVTKKSIGNEKLVNFFIN